MDNNETVAEHAVRAMAVLGWAGGGALVGLAIAVVLLVIIYVAGRKSVTMRQIYRRTRLPLCVALMLLGAWGGFELSDANTGGVAYAVIQRLLLLALIIGFGWYFYSLTYLIHDITGTRIARDGRDAKRLRTQSEVFQRVLQTVVVVATVIGCLLTFPAVRAPLASLLASAGLLSVVVGLAAQSSLGNMFAGIQLAITDSVRVGDTVTIVVASKEVIGAVEEVTLTYVVVRSWNDRRVLVPSSEFTTKAFENWTRHSPGQVGDVEIYLDYLVPVEAVRGQVKELLNSTDLWDRQTWNVQVIAAGPANVTLRVVASAKDPTDRWSLECYVREHLLAWIGQEMPDALPRTRSQAVAAEEEQK